MAASHTQLDLIRLDVERTAERFADSDRDKETLKAELEELILQWLSRQDPELCIYAQGLPDLLAVCLYRQDVPTGMRRFELFLEKLPHGYLSPEDQRDSMPELEACFQTLVDLMAATCPQLCEHLQGIEWVFAMPGFLPSFHMSGGSSLLPVAAASRLVDEVLATSIDATAQFLANAMVAKKTRLLACTDNTDLVQFVNRELLSGVNNAQEVEELFNFSPEDGGAETPTTSEDAMDVGAEPATLPRAGAQTATMLARAGAQTATISELPSEVAVYSVPMAVKVARAPTAWVLLNCCCLFILLWRGTQRRKESTFQVAQALSTARAVNLNPSLVAPPRASAMAWGSKAARRPRMLRPAKAPKQD